MYMNYEHPCSKIRITSYLSGSSLNFTHLVTGIRLMTTDMNFPTLASLEFFPYLDAEGKLLTTTQSKIGVYSIFNQEQQLQFVGYSRDVYSSLKQHLVRRPHCCYWLKLQTIERPSRTLLEQIRDAWITENGITPPGNGPDAPLWNEPINVKPAMTVEELTRYQSDNLEDIDKEKLLKNVARRVESQILAELEKRGVQEEIRFNPKLKSSGLLDLK